jgi:PHD/YefM family antitoxin component YafN of YafNO toxin-antitoxin module
LTTAGRRVIVRPWEIVLGGGGAAMARTTTTEEGRDVADAMKAVRRGRPVYIRRQGRKAYVLLSVRRFHRMLERLEDLEDAADADRAIREFEASGARAIPWERIKRELGLA